MMKEKPLLKGRFPMRYGYSAHLHEDVISQVQAALHSKGIVNVAAVAEVVRVQNLAENVALEDIEHLVVQAAQFYGAAMEFDGLTAIGLAPFGPLPGERQPRCHRGQGHCA